MTSISALFYCSKISVLDPVLIRHLPQFPRRRRGTAWAFGAAAAHLLQGVPPAPAAGAGEVTAAVGQVLPGERGTFF